MAGHEDCHRVIYPPRFECLPPTDQSAVFHFTSFLFKTNLPYFEPHGKLYPFLRSCAASMVMYHFNLQKDHGPNNSIVKTVRSAASAAGIWDPTVSQDETIVWRWSETIMEDFHSRNRENPTPDSPGSVKMLGQQVEDLHQQNAKLRNDLRTVMNSLDRIESMLGEFEHKGFRKRNADDVIATDDVIEILSSPESEKNLPCSEMQKNKNWSLT